MSVIVRLMSGIAMKVDGDRWTEPPAQPSPIPGTLKADHEITEQQAADLRVKLLARARDHEGLVLGPGLTYIPIEESLFVIVYRGDDKVASFNPVEVLAVYTEGFAETLEE
jgi:hypothetical protein